FEELALPPGHEPQHRHVLDQHREVGAADQINLNASSLSPNSATRSLPSTLISRFNGSTRSGSRPRFDPGVLPLPWVEAPSMDEPVGSPAREGRAQPEPKVSAASFMSAATNPHRSL